MLFPELFQYLYVICVFGFISCLASLFEPTTDCNIGYPIKITSLFLGSCALLLFVSHAVLIEHSDLIMEGFGVADKLNSALQMETSYEFPVLSVLLVDKHANDRGGWHYVDYIDVTIWRLLCKTGSFLVNDSNACSMDVATFPSMLRFNALRCELQWSMWTTCIISAYSSVCYGD